MPTLLTIGDFSRASYLTIKTLRHYHDVGLLEPAHVDGSSGYPYYRADQITTAQTIRRLREGIEGSIGILKDRLYLTAELAAAPASELFKRPAAVAQFTLSTSVRASHGAAGAVIVRVSLQSRMSLRSAKYQAPSILVKASR